MQKSVEHITSLMYSMRRNARVVASEKCWSGIDVKMREISRDVNENWLRIGHVSTTCGKIFLEMFRRL